MRLLFGTLRYFHLSASSKSQHLNTGKSRLKWEGRTWSLNSSCFPTPHVKLELSQPDSGSLREGTILIWHNRRTQIFFCYKNIPPHRHTDHMAIHGHSPGLHPAFRPERSDLSIQKHLHIIFPRMDFVVLLIIVLQFYLHHPAEQLPKE